jgi:D-galactarolactone isomerase
MHGEPPRLIAPPGSCDCHIHIYGDRSRYPTAPSCRYPPPRATLAQYRDVMRRLRIERAIVVQPTAYGFDNRCTLDALAELGSAVGRGVVTISAETERADIARMTEAGVRGARFFMLPGAILTWHMVMPIARAIADFGWHIQLQLDGRSLPDHEELLRRIPCPLVIDHNGKFLEPVPVTHPGTQSLLRLLETGRVWVKASAPYETSKSGAPRYDDVAEIARKLVSAAPDRVVWATNWPHGAQENKPDDADLLDLLFDWAPSTELRNKILIQNPHTLYFRT